MRLASQPRIVREASFIGEPAFSSLEKCESRTKHKCRKGTRAIRASALSTFLLFRFEACFRLRAYCSPALFREGFDLDALVLDLAPRVVALEGDRAVLDEAAGHALRGLGRG